MENVTPGIVAVKIFNYRTRPTFKYAIVEYRTHRDASMARYLCSYGSVFIWPKNKCMPVQIQHQNIRQSRNALCLKIGNFPLLTISLCVVVLFIFAEESFYPFHNFCKLDMYLSLYKMNGDRQSFLPSISVGVEDQSSIPKVSNSFTP